jgi:hypothetical protein
MGRGDVVLIAAACLVGVAAEAAAERVNITIERHVPGAPVTFGVPFPRGAVDSPDHVRVLDRTGREIPAQVDEVTTWAPVDPSLKWAWVFFFADRGDRYVLEFGRSIRRTLPVGAALQVLNNPRDRGQVDIVAGRLHATLSQGEGGFLNDVRLDLEGDGFEEDDVIAVGPQKRGSFLDLLDDAGIDAASAVVGRTYLERGSGPLHVIVRVEGEYRYGRADNRSAPFITRIHAYAGKSYLRVLHTIVYTGTPDRHAPFEGEFPHIATQTSALTFGNPGDEGWTVPDDRIAAIGFGMALKLTGTVRVRTGLRNGAWWERTPARVVERAPGLVGSAGQARTVSVTQMGPGVDPSSPPGDSGPDRRREGFRARVEDVTGAVDESQSAEGWIDVSDDTRGVAFGIRHFLEEYPKELRFDAATGDLHAYFWSPKANPMSFARATSKPGAEGAVENWAQGLAKTSEAIVFFHDGRTSAAEIAATMRLVLVPPVAHVESAWYGKSGVYGRFAPRGTDAALDRALAYKFDWVLFSQRWAPWYGMFDHGDLKVRYDNGQWDMWGANEPAQDLQLWVEFMRTGDPRLFDAAQALSRHTMDVDNTHWPAGPDYRGDTNQSADYFKSLAGPPASPWLGIGRRHAQQHWMHVLSAHVWVQGWLADYYLGADHRGLDVARITADMHLRHMWGEHEMTARRLYLAVWNLAGVWDATKDPKYGDDLKVRVAAMLRQQQANGGSLAIERYGYSQVYATHGLRAYLDLTDDAEVRRALVRHARQQRDLPSLSHFMESFLASQHALAVGYELTGEMSFRAELKRRTDLLRVDPLERPIDDAWTPASLARALASINHIPDAPSWYRREFSDTARRRSPNWAPEHGLRFFGWTHGHGLPWALAALSAPPAAGGSPRPATPRAPAAESAR